MSKDYRINDQIRGTREIRAVDENGEQLGVLPLYQALQMAQERGLDLVEVAPTAVPPVCRIMDFGKFKYEQTKKEREARKHQKSQDLSEVRLRPGIDAHDIAFKTRTARKMLTEGDKVKLTVMFRGREMAHPERGAALLKRLAEELKDVAVLERVPLMEGRRLEMILAPAATAVKPPPKAKEQPKEQPKAKPAEPAKAATPESANA